MGIKKQSDSLVDTLSEDLINSSEIEGVYLHPDSVRSSISRKLGLENDGMLKEDHYVDGLVDVMLDAIGNCGSPLTADRLFGWHAALFPTGRSGMYKIAVGEWRSGDSPMQVVSGVMGSQKVHYEAPASDRVGEMMDVFMEWANTESLPPFLMAAVAHLWFLTIHPFDDGNGRISRTIADMLISRAEDGGSRYFSVSAEINRNKRRYYEILETTQKRGLDITEWILWFLDITGQAMGAALSKVDRVLEKARYWDRFREVEINERQHKVINRLWDGFDGKLTTMKWAKICHVSQDTALRDIKDLIAKGMLLRGSDGGRSSYYLLSEE